MATFPRPFEEYVRQVKETLQRAGSLLISHPAIPLLAAVTWGIELLGEYRESLNFIVIIVTYVFSVAFFGVVAELLSSKNPKVNGKLIGTAIRKLTIGTIVITMAYSLPLLVLLPTLNAALGLGLKEKAWVPVVSGGLIVVPSIAAMWSLAYRRSPLAQAIIDGIAVLRGRWVIAICLGLAYQGAAWGAKVLRIELLELDPVFAGIAALVWAAIEGIFRLALLLWLFGDVTRPKRK